MNLDKFTSQISSPHKAARVVGLGLLIMFFLAIIAEGAVLSTLIVSGDAATTINNIKDNELKFLVGIASYFIVLVLDVVIALALYVLLKPVNKTLSLYTAVFRVLYTAIWESVCLP